MIVELQVTEYNKYAPRANEVIAYPKTIGYDCVAPKFSDNGPDKGYSFWIQNEYLIVFNVVCHGRRVGDWWW